MSRASGFKRTDLEIAKQRVSAMKTCLRNKASKHQRDIELQIEKIKAAEVELQKLEAKESE